MPAPAWSRPPSASSDTQTPGSKTVKAPAALTRRSFRTSDGVRLSWLAGGTASRLDPLLFLPGWCMPADIFMPQLQAFASSRTVWALDLRGQGESEIPQRGYEADRRARDLFEFLGKMRRAPIVVAWSLAGIEMLHGLRRFGDARLKALVLVDSSLGEGPAGNGEGVAAFRAALSNDRAATLEGFARAIFRTQQPPEYIAHLVAAMSRAPLEASQSMLDYRLPREGLRDTARRFGKPLMVTCIPQYREQARLHSEARPKTRVELFEEAGHALFVDEPERFNRVLDSFSRSLKAGSPGKPRR
jgi:microsomal epoxide hydrolase